MVVKTWTSRPLSLAIVEVLEKKGAMSDAELFDALKDTQEDLGFGMLNQTLMRLEVEGKAYDSWLAKGKRRGEPVKRKEK